MGDPESDVYGLTLMECHYEIKQELIRFQRSNTQRRFGFQAGVEEFAPHLLNVESSSQILFLYKNYTSGSNYQMPEDCARAFFLMFKTQEDVEEFIRKDRSDRDDKLDDEFKRNQAFNSKCSR